LQAIVISWLKLAVKETNLVISSKDLGLSSLACGTRTADQESQILISFEA